MVQLVPQAVPHVEVHQHDPVDVQHGAGGGSTTGTGGAG